MKKAILKFEICTDATDGESGRQVDVFAPVCLYREDGDLVWRIGGPMGDEVETLPRPATVVQAKADAKAVYGGSVWMMRATWE